MLAFILSTALFFSSLASNDIAMQAMSNALNDECVFVGENIGADYCAYQFTDVEIDDQFITSRAQLSLGCDDQPWTLQEAEYIVSVRIRDAEMVRADLIYSAHLPDGGVNRFTRMFCDPIDMS